MSNDNSSEYEIRANPSPFVAGMDKAEAAAKKAAKEIENSFKSLESSMQTLTNAFKSVTSVIGTMTAVIAGGKAFKEVIDSSNAWTGEAKKLSVQLGITTERASVMMVAMRHLGIDSEMVSMASGKMSKQIATNGQAFEKLGVAVKDSHGQYRPTLDIMGEVNNKLKEIKNPIEQNIAGTQVYGKSWNEVRGILKLTTDETKKAEQRAKELGLVVGEESVAQTKKYKESINDMKLVMTALEVQFGSTVMPAFVALGSWLGSVGPVVAKAMGMAMESLGNIAQIVGETVMDLWSLVSDGFSQFGGIAAKVFGTEIPGAMEIFSNSMKVIEIAFTLGRIAITQSIEIIKLYIELLVISAMTMAKVVMSALKGDFSGAREAWKRGTLDAQSIFAEHQKKMIDIAEKGKEKIDSIAMRPPKAESKKIRDEDIGRHGPTYDFSKDGDDKAKSRMHEWEAKLGADKDGYAKEQAIAGTAMEYSHTQERDYWKRILDTVKMSKEERAQVEKKYYAVTAMLRKEAFENEIAGEKLALENFKHNHIEREEIAQRIYKQTVARYGADSKEAKAAMADVLKERKAFAEQSLATSKVISEAQKNAALAGVDAEEQSAEFLVATNQMTQAKLLQLQEAFEAKRYQIKMGALIEQENAMRGKDEDPTALAQIHAQIEAMEQQHQARMGAIKNKQFIEQNKNVLAMTNTVQSGLASVIAGTLNGTIKASNILRSLMQSVLGAVVDLIAKTAAQWAMDALFKQALSSASALGQITANAGVAGSAAYAATAGIPVIGPAMAPAAAAAAMTGAMSFAPMASAAGGYDIPAGLNPIVQTHAREMILPAKHADVIRSLSDGGGAAVGNSNPIHYHDYSGRLSPSDIRRNVKVIADALRDHSRRQ